MSELASPTPHPAVAALVGATVSDVRRLTEETPDLVVAFGDRLLHVECGWRVVDAARLRLTSSEHGHRYGLPAPIDVHAAARELLLGRRVTAIEGGSVPADLVVVLDDRRLEVRPDYSGYEAWHFHAHGLELLAWAGGQVSELETGADGVVRTVK